MGVTRLALLQQLRDGAREALLGGEVEAPRIIGRTRTIAKAADAVGRADSFVIVRTRRELRQRIVKLSSGGLAWRALFVVLLQELQDVREEQNSLLPESARSQELPRTQRRRVRKLFSRDS